MDGFVLLGFTLNVLNVSMFVVAFVLFGVVACKAHSNRDICHMQDLWEHELRVQVARQLCDHIRAEWRADENSICEQLDRKYANQAPKGAFFCSADAPPGRC